MKFLIALNILLSIGLGYFVYENHKKTKSIDSKFEDIHKMNQRTEKSVSESSKELLELKVRLQKLDKNVNGHKIGDSLRNQIGALQSDVEALEKKLR